MGSKPPFGSDMLFGLVEYDNDGANPYWPSVVSVLGGEKACCGRGSDDGGELVDDAVTPLFRTNRLLVSMIPWYVARRLRGLSSLFDDNVIAGCSMVS